MNPKLIKTEADHNAALARIDALWDARPETPDGEELELLVHLVEEYEEATCPIPMPDALGAIRFRMEQEGLKPADLVPFIGNKSKVSEVLNGKRPLSLSMIRKLHSGLGIPADVLLRDAPVQPSDELAGMAWREFPLAEMVKRDWFGKQVGDWRELLERAEEILGSFLLPPGLPRMATVRLRQSPGKSGKTNEKALWAWKARVWHLAQQQKTEPFRSGIVGERLMGEVARLSPLENGPLVARDMLSKLGIRLVFEPPMPHTHLDGAAIRGSDGSMLIAMTLRHDRLDNFWFTLVHELAHLALHLKDEEGKVFMDDLEAEDRDQDELAADRLTLKAMMPEKAWQRFKSNPAISKTDLIAFAAVHRLHPSIPAGRLRRERGDYRLFHDLVGFGKVRSLLL